jgi:hypothetical protein
MKVTIGNYRSWFGPYQLAELLCFWVKPVKDEYGMSKKPDWVFNFGHFLATGKFEKKREVGDVWSDKEEKQTLLYRFLQWIHSKQKRTIKVQIDRWDTWSMDNTLAHIILPMLKQLKQQKHGAPYVDRRDCPKELHGNKLTKKQLQNGEVDDKHFDRWDYVLDEMIFAFESELDEDRHEQFQTGVRDTQWKQLENGNVQMIKGPNDTFVYDFELSKQHQARVDNGFRLFGKYYQSLWS